MKVYSEFKNLKVPFDYANPNTVYLDTEGKIKIYPFTPIFNKLKEKAEKK